MRTEPNWTRTVNSRRNAWEQQAQNVDARVQLPASAKVPPPQPPYWADRSHLAQNTWQSTANRLQNQQQWGVNQSGQPWAFYNPSESYANNVARESNQNFVSNVQTTNYENQNSAPQQYSQRTSSYNSNSVPQPPPRQDYNSSSQNQSYNQHSNNYSTRTVTNNTQQAAIPLPPPPSSENNSFKQNTTYSYQQSQPQLKQTPGQIVTESSSTSKTENRNTSTKAIPLPPPRNTGSQNYVEQRTRNYEKTTEERTIPAPAPPPRQEEGRIIQQNDYNRYYKKVIQSI